MVITPPYRENLLFSPFSPEAHRSTQWHFIRLRCNHTNQTVFVQNRQCGGWDCPIDKWNNIRFYRVRHYKTCLWHLDIKSITYFCNSNTGFSYYSGEMLEIGMVMVISDSEVIHNSAKITLVIHKPHIANLKK